MDFSSLEHQWLEVPKGELNSGLLYSNVETVGFASGLIDAILLSMSKTQSELKKKGFP